jgi:carboxypeptidase Taq
MIMQEKLDQLKQILAQISDLKRSANLLNWDQNVYMPPGGARTRGDQLATLSQLAHERFTSAEVGKLLDYFNPRLEEFDPESDDPAMIKVVTRHFNRLSKVPSDWVAEFARVTALSQQAWAEAKVENNFSKFLPHLEKVILLTRQYAGFFAPFDHIYDPLLDGFEPGLKTAEVQSIFKDIHPRLMALIHAIGEKEPVNNEFLHQAYDADKQWDFAVEVLKKIGYNWAEGRMDVSLHPFTIELGHGDVRITTHVDKDFFNPAFFSSLHEGGHALYEQGIPAAFYRTFLDEGASMAIHESQSRLWENLVGRSFSFWKYFYPQLQYSFLEQLGGIELEAFYNGINRVEPTPVRVDADEATYTLHIILRLELEIALIEGSLQAKDLPAVWNERMRESLGIVPDNDAKGVLQDIHWADGLFGYFPTYALGNVIAAQLWEKINLDHPDLQAQLELGDFSVLLKWLRKNIHRHGAKFEPQELLQRVTGSKIDPKPYIQYLESKFGAIYGLRG